MLLLKKTVLFSLLLTAIFLISCSDSDSSEELKDDLELLSTFDIAIAEPSGLTINSSGTVLYTVSDNTAQVYRLTTEGNVIQTFSYKGNDLEGVSIYTGNKLLLAEERTKEVVEFDMSTGNFTKHKIDYENNEENSGIEGVAFAENLNNIFILNEKSPGKLIRLRSDFSVLAEYDLNFASDYSGIFYENSSNNLWIVSDQNKTLNKCTLKGELIDSYSIRITQAEGVAITNDKIYIISDAEEKLYVYKKPQ
ncbi:MAG: hypothetical protein GQ552_08075 [Flavobacteriaceae bacterium]|nr:hypothetical protein [Flavobacteriaceae bacterium]